ncbi:MAG: acyl-CoA dehydrogenase, partial [Oligoflexales bacterium]|nr:acyl-CoA dehydrogenase [Oligoflexales bacterium]
AQALGICEAAYNCARNYSKERIQFGKPISNIQAVQFLLADMITKIDAASLLVLKAANLRMEGKNYTREASEAKVFSAEAAMWITTKAVQVLGGNGYTKDFPAERYFRDAKITEIYEGTSEIQRVVIASSILRN